MARWLTKASREKVQPLDLSGGPQGVRPKVVDDVADLLMGIDDKALEHRQMARQHEDRLLPMFSGPLEHLEA